jgi:hypothetical protein
MDNSSISFCDFLALKLVSGKCLFHMKKISRVSSCIELRCRNSCTYTSAEMQSSSVLKVLVQSSLDVSPVVEEMTLKRSLL